MSDLDGNLKVFGPITALQMPNLAQASGRLELQTNSNSASVFFEKGNVTYADMTDQPMKLGEYLLREGVITPSVLEKTLSLKPKGRRLGQVLLEAGVIGEQDLQTALKEQIKEVIYEVVRWQEGRFVFTAGERPQDTEVLIDSPLDHLMLEGLKRLDEERGTG